MSNRRDVDDAQLHRIAAIAADIGAARLSADALSVAERVVEGRFYVACLGQFKRGKSTLLNALVDHTLLPAAILPVTAVPTVLRYGVDVRVRVRFTNGTSAEVPVGELESYVSEELNPENAKRVDIVDVFVPSPLLADGMCLVDTPGIGSVFASNTATTRSFIPHVDVALIVIGADPPISGEELALVEEVGRTVPNVVVVLNKADRVTGEDRDQAVAFTTKMVNHRLRRPVGPVYAVSAAERLTSAGPPRDWFALVETLRRLSNTGARGIVHESGRRGLKRVADGCLAEIDTALHALREPLDEADYRISALKVQLGRIAFQLPRLNALVAMEQQQIAQLLSERRDAFLAVTIPAATAELRTRIPSATYRVADTLRSESIVMARHVAQEYLRPWFEGEEKFAGDLYRETAIRFVNLANTFLDQLTTERNDIDWETVSVPRTAYALDPDRTIKAESTFYFHDVESLVRTMSPLPSLLAIFRPHSAVQRDIAQRAEWYLEQLLQINSTRVRNDIDDRIAESGRQLEAEIRALLRDVSASAERAVQRARVARAEGAERVALEISHLEALQREVTDIRAGARDSSASSNPTDDENRDETENDTENETGPSRSAS